MHRSDPRMVPVGILSDTGNHSARQYGQSEKKHFRFSRKFIGTVGTEPVGQRSGKTKCLIQNCILSAIPENIRQFACGIPGTAFIEPGTGIIGRNNAYRKRDRGSTFFCQSGIFLHAVQKTFRDIPERIPCKIRAEIGSFIKTDRSGCSRLNGYHPVFLRQQYGRQHLRRQAPCRSHNPHCESGQDRVRSRQLSPRDQ